MSKKVTQEECIAELQRLYQECGKLSIDLVKEHGRISRDTIAKRCGGLQTAYQLAGVEYFVPGEKRHTPKQNVVGDLLRIHQEHGRMSKPLYQQYGKYTPKVVARVFGSFEAMYKELGFDRDMRGYVASDDELIEELLRLQSDHGIVTADVIKKQGRFSTTTYQERFGGVNNAYKLAGLMTRNPGECSHAKWVISRYGQVLSEEPLLEHRFDWLRNPITNRVLPVDGYFPHANVIIEYNGPQHYHVDGHYSPDEEALEYRQWLDTLKYDLIRERGIHLIVVDYRHTFNEQYIVDTIGA